MAYEVLLKSFLKSLVTLPTMTSANKEKGLIRKDITKRMLSIVTDLTGEDDESSEPHIVKSQVVNIESDVQLDIVDRMEEQELDLAVLIPTEEKTSESLTETLTELRKLLPDPN